MTPFAVLRTLQLHRGFAKRPVIRELAAESEADTIIAGGKRSWHRSTSPTDEYHGDVMSHAESWNCTVPAAPDTVGHHHLKQSAACL